MLMPIHSVCVTSAALLRTRPGFEDPVTRSTGHWVGDAVSSGIAEMTGLVTKLRQDLEAALATGKRWGEVEGPITTRTFIRRQVSGRGTFNLARKRVLRITGVRPILSVTAALTLRNAPRMRESQFSGGKSFSLQLSCVWSRL